MSTNDPTSGAPGGYPGGGAPSAPQYPGAPQAQPPMGSPYGAPPQAPIGAPPGHQPFGAGPAAGPYGAPPPGGPAPLGGPGVPTPPKKRSLGAKIAFAIGALLILVLVGGFIQSIVSGIVGKTTTGGSENSSTERVLESGSGDADRPRSKEGTEAVPVGKTVRSGPWQVLVDSFTPNATDAIMDEGNDAPPSGEDYVLVRMTLTYAGSEEAGEDYLFTDFVIVDDRGEENSWEEVRAAAPDDIFGHAVTVLKPGESRSGDLLFQVDSGRKLTLRIGSDADVVEVPLS